MIDGRIEEKVEQGKEEGREGDEGTGEIETTKMVVHVEDLTQGKGE